METSETSQLIEVPLESVSTTGGSPRGVSTNTQDTSATKWPFCTFRIRMVVVIAIVCIQLPVLMYYISTSEYISLVRPYLSMSKDDRGQVWRNLTTVIDSNKTQPAQVDISVTQVAQAVTATVSMVTLTERTIGNHATTLTEPIAESRNTSRSNSVDKLTNNNESASTEDDKDVVSKQTQSATVSTTTKSLNETQNYTNTAKPDSNETNSDNKPEDNASEVKDKNETEEEVLPSCPDEPPNLQGRLRISFEAPPKSFDDTARDNPLVQKGGHGKPPYCVAKWKVAIIIPYRHREEHLHYFVQYMHPILQRQQVDYQIFIINQAGQGKFNRAKLMNIGFVEALKLYPFQCFAFHDVDLILEDDRSLYWCSDKPRHLSAGVDKFNYVLPYSQIFGGATMISKEQMEAINGFSNSFWGWGGEDDDVFNRLKLKGYGIIRYPMNIAKYKMIVHKKERGNEPNPRRFDMIRKTKQTMDKDGLNSLDYQVVSVDLQPTYTNITVDVKPPK